MNSTQEGHIKTIRIFLASSGELLPERKDFRDFISVQNDLLIRKRLYLELIDWENGPASLNITGTQSLYNQQVKECDIIVCLFHTRAGPYTRQEFDAALEQFTDTGKPLIYVWLKTGQDKVIPVSGENKSLRQFRKYLDQLGHFYDRFTGYADLRNQFRHQLDLILEKSFPVYLREKQQETVVALKSYKRKLILRALYIAAGFAVVTMVAVLLTLKWFTYRQSLEPFGLTVFIENKTPVKELPGPVGHLSLNSGGKPDSKDSVRTEARFENIPGQFRKDSLRLQYNAKGFWPVDTSFLFHGEKFTLPVYRNNDLATLKGLVVNDAGSPLAGVLVFNGCCSTVTDSGGRYVLNIPLPQQRIKQQLHYQKKSYKSRNYLIEVSAEEIDRVILSR